MSTIGKTAIKNLIAIPALITLAVTLLRLAGELLNWSNLLFNKAAGGGGALIGIAWLVPIFGIYFTRRLLKSNDQPASAGRLFAFAALGLIVFAALFALALQLPNGSIGQMLVVIVAAAGSLVLARRAWPALFSVLFAYGLAARFPVIVIMFMAIMGNWGTHYDAPPPNLPPEIAPLTRWIVTGLIPQLTLWMVFTVTIGMIFGGLAFAATARKPVLAKAAS
jgi:hypothetical protein